MTEKTQKKARRGAPKARKAGPVERGWFKAEDDTSIFYEVQGQGKPLILCYGLVCRRTHWNHQLARFLPRYQVITFDYRAHHRSTQPRNDRNLTLDWCARDVQSLMDHLGLKQAVVAGHSLGVPVCELAMLRDKRIKAGIWICGAVSNPFDHMFYTDRLNLLYQFTRMAHRFTPDTAERAWSWLTKRTPVSYLLTAQLGFNPETANPGDIVNYMQGVHETPFKVFQSFLRDYAEFDGRDLLADIKKPVLIIAGEDDLITPMYLMEEMNELLVKGEFARVARASHNAHSDFPDEVNERIDAFLTRIRY